MAANDLEQQIADAAKAPRRASNESGSAEAHALRDLIEADRHLAAKCAAKTRRLGIRFIRSAPPGA